MYISGVYGNNSTVDLPMTEEQKTSLTDTLGNYDPENMTAEDMLAMRKEMTEAGIPRSRETMEMLREAGFKPPKPAASTQGTPSLVDLLDEESNTGVQQGELWDLYTQMQNGEISQVDFLSRIGGQAMGTGSLIDYIS